MKKILILAVLCSLVFVCCKTSQKQAYLIPEEYTGTTRAKMDEMLQAGQRLYKLHCSGCHGIFGNGRDSVPNFSKTQIEAYRSTALLDDPRNHAVARKLRMEDLDLILQFLDFRITSATKR